VILGKVRHQLQRGHKFVVGLVKLLFLAEHYSQREMQRGILGVCPNHTAKINFGLVELLCPGLSRSFQQCLGNGRPNPGRPRIPGTDDDHEVLACSGGFQLPKFTMRRQSSQPAFPRQPSQPAARYATYQPGSQLGHIYRLRAGCLPFG
jgi:hypothetical protein